MGKGMPQVCELCRPLYFFFWKEEEEEENITMSQISEAVSSETRIVSLAKLKLRI